jgi:hypothetical protein
MAYATSIGHVRGSDKRGAGHLIGWFMRNAKLSLAPVKLGAINRRS